MFVVSECSIPLGLIPISPFLSERNHFTPLMISILSLFHVLLARSMGYTLNINLNSAYSRTLVHCELQICEFSLTHEGKQFSYLRKSIICVELKSISSGGIRGE